MSVKRMNCPQTGVCVVIASLIGVAVAALPAGASLYDAWENFSIGSNPHGVWSYGHETNLSGPLVLYTVTGSSPGSWRAWLSSGTYFANPPYIASNLTNAALCIVPTVCIPKKHLHLHPGSTGDYSVLRFTAKGPGTYKIIQGAFEGIDCMGPTSTDVHVIVTQSSGQSPLLNAPITTCGAPIPIPSTPVSLLAGDTIDFAVGWGSDGNYNFDSTALTVKIVGP